MNRGLLIWVVALLGLTVSAIFIFLGAGLITLFLAGIIGKPLGLFGTALFLLGGVSCYYPYAWFTSKV